VPQPLDEPLLLGAVADDVTGGADLAGMLSERGVATVLALGVPTEALVRRIRGRFSACVVSLKSRSIPAPDAVRLSVAALRALEPLGPRQIQFKYCSTFDSTAAGNIGPVAEALMDALGVRFAVAVPALPVNGRSLYLGHLFVDGVLLAESHMRHHPVTPMTDSNLVRQLQAQTQRRVGLVPLDVVRRGPDRIARTVAALEDAGTALALVDATADEDVAAIAEAVADHRLITGSSALARALPDVWRRRGLLPHQTRPALSEQRGHLLFVAGSCSARTHEQLRLLEQVGVLSIRVDPLRVLAAGADERERLKRAVGSALEQRGVALVRSTAGPEELADGFAAAEAAGTGAAGLRAAIEAVAGEVARHAVSAAGARHIVVAGGETTGAVLDALGLEALEVGPSLDPGVPLCRSVGPTPLTLVPKSGNFGAPDLLVRILERLGPA
jgi:3-dehydrotetronate 4-kinase